jgi:polysaccharide pyruvyl transferase WcaK-like protein
LSAETPLLSYLGWSGRGNLGDDAIHDALAKAFPHAVVAPLPLYAKETARLLFSPVRLRRARGSTLLLGGGTVIGRANWRMHLRVGLGLVAKRPAWMVGAGVEDPDFTGRNSFSAPGELRRWTPLLRHFGAVTVRGPRSAELLADIGVDARVVGDPALLLEPHHDAGPRLSGTVGVNVGYGDDLWGHDALAVITVVARALRRLVSRGLQVRFLVANRADLDDTLRCAALAGIANPDLRIAVAPAQYLGEVAACDAVIGQRLHAVVLAAAAAVPAVMLEYQPKCLDFMRVIGREAWSIRVDRLEAGTLVELVEELVVNTAAHAAALARAVSTLRAGLRAETDRISDALSAHQVAA